VRVLGDWHFPKYSALSKTRALQNLPRYCCIYNQELGGVAHRVTPGR
jgi:hypothetical protein